MADDYTADTTTTGRLDSGLAIGDLEAAGDRDWFRVFLYAGHNYVIDQRGQPTAGGTLTDPLLNLQSPAGTLLASNDDGGFGFESQLAVHVTNSGYYYADAGAFSSNIGTYALQLTDLGIGAATARFEPIGNGPPNLPVFGASSDAGGWSSQNSYPRAAGDVNGDGQADIVGFGGDGVYVSLSLGGGHFSSPIKVLANFGPNAGGWLSQEVNPRLLGDVTADGRADIVAFASNGVYVSSGNTDGTFAAPTFALAALGSDVGAGGWNSFDRYPRQIADVNGDGRQDVVGFASDGVYVALSNGDGTFQPLTTALLGMFGSNATAGGWASQDTYPRLTGDVNGDGRGDIVAFAQDGVYVALGNPDGTFASAILALSGFGNDAGFASQNLTPRLVADINADSRADIVAFGPSGVSFALGQADGTFGAITTDLAQFGSDPAAGGWTSNDLYPRLLADVTGDFRADIIGFGEAGAFLSPAHDFFALT